MGPLCGTQADFGRAVNEPLTPEFLFHLLPRIEDSFRTRQAMSPCSAGLECRNDRPDSPPRRPASPLRTHGSVMLCLRTHFWRTTAPAELDFPQPGTRFGGAVPGSPAPLHTPGDEPTDCVPWELSIIHSGSGNQR